MATPAMNFVAVCANANIPFTGTKASHIKLLKESCGSVPVNPSNADAKEHFVMLAWALHAVAKSIKPSKWSSML